LKITLLPSAYAPAVGGVEELTRCLARRYVLDGHAVEIWVNRHPRGLPAVEAIEGVTVRRYPMVLPAGNPRSALEFMVGAADGLRGMSRAFRVFRPEVLHVQCFSGNGVYATALSRLFQTPLIVSLQGETVMDDHDIYERSASLRLGLRSGLRAASVVTGCSQFVLNDAVARFGLTRSRGEVVPNGADNDLAVQPEPISVPFKRFVLAMGRVVEKKGFDLLIDAFKLVADRHPDVGLLIGGDGAARSGLQELVKDLGLEGRVLLPGRFTRANVRWATANATTFVLPSRVEPFGIVILEAMAAGLPVVVSARGGASEIVRDGVDGLVVDPFDREALAAAVDRLLNDPTERERFAAAGCERARAFDWSLIAARYVELYKLVLGAPRN
jgi:glycosyltransferase involved in cell wall biosynthesis